MKKFLCFSLLMNYTILNAFNESELNSLLKNQNWELLIPKVREAFKKKDMLTLAWIKKEGELPHVPFIYESMRSAVKRALTEKELQKLLSITIIALIITILDLLSCEKLKYMNTLEQEQTYNRIKENFRHHLYYKAPILQQYWEANMPYKDFKLQYSHIIAKAKKSYQALLEKKTTLPNPIWVTKVANTSFLKLRYWIDFGTPSQETFIDSQKPESLETIKNIREKNADIVWSLFFTISDWMHFFALTAQDIATYINNQTKNPLWLSLMVGKDSSIITVN